MIEWIQQPQQLSTLIERLSLAQTPFISLDTEFVRRSSFYAEPGLLQIGWISDKTTCVALIDLVALRHTSIRNLLQSIFRLTHTQQIPLVMHAPTEDLQIFDFYNIERDFYQLLDTQIAAAFLYDHPQISLFDLAQKIIPNRALLPSLAQSNWVKRPLNWSEISYAAQDAILLCEIAQVLPLQLPTEHYEFVLEDAENLYKTWPLINRDKPYASFHSQITRIQPNLRSRLAHLMSWREKAIRDLNVPRKWHLSDDALVAIAKLGEVQSPPKFQAIMQLLYSSHAKTLNRYKLKPESKDLFLASLDIPDLYDEFYEAWKELPSFPEEYLPVILNKNTTPLLDALENLAYNYADENKIPRHAFMKRTWLKQLMQSYKKRNTFSAEPLPPVFSGWRSSFLERVLRYFQQHQFK